MSAAHRHTHGLSAAELDDLLDHALANPRIKARLARPYQLVTRYDIALLGSSAIGGARVYLDRHLRENGGAYGIVAIGKRRLDVKPALIRHERLEQALEDEFGWDYDKLAHPVATHFEERDYKAKGFDPREVEKAFDPFIKADSNEKIQKSPTDIDLRPMLSPKPDKALIARVKAAGQAEKKPQEAVGYISKSAQPNRSCGKCVMFVAGKYGGPDCTLVRGPIVAGGVCRRFRASGRLDGVVKRAGGGRVGYGDGGMVMPVSDPLDFSGQYNTPLGPQGETAFQQWTSEQSRATGRNVGADSYDYDLRGWFSKNGPQPLTGAHLTDEFKKPNHPTFSDQSQYHGVDDFRGGQWGQHGDGSWSFTPGDTTMFSPDELRDYFTRVEPGNKLNIRAGALDGVTRRAAGGRAEGGAADDPLASVLAGRDQDNPYAGKLASILTDIGSGVVSLPERMIGASENRRTGGPYDPRPALEAAMLTMGATPFGMARMGAGEAALGAGPIRAYHGSPHDFDRFDMSKIGTGEGAQAYGRGLYFAENEATAQSYRDALSGGNTKWLLGDKELTGAEQNAAELLERTGGDKDKALAHIKYALRPMRLADHAYLDATEHAVKQINPADIKVVQNPGRMYETSINADPEHFLDWDKPLSEQSDHVRRVINELGEIKPRLGSVSLDSRFSASGEPTGSNIYAWMTQRKEGQMPPWDMAGTTEKLRNAGIPGIKYLDQGSRPVGDLAAAERELSEVRQAIAVVERQTDSATQSTRLARLKANEARLAQQVEQPTRNYVLFRDDIIDILRKYGIAGLIGAGAAHYKEKAAQ